MNNVETQTFESNIGSPQVDGLSGTLFNVYFEYVLRKLRTKLDENCTIPYTIMPDETIYADDADFLTTNMKKDAELNRIVKNILIEDNLKSKRNEDRKYYDCTLRCGTDVFTGGSEESLKSKWPLTLAAFNIMSSS